MSSAIGLTSLLPTLLLDVTGLAFATAIGVLGFLVLPRKRKQVSRQFDTRLDNLCSGFKETLTQQLDHALDHVTTEIEHNISPLLGLCRQQRKQSERRLQKVQEMRAELARLESDLRHQFGTTP